ncbi:MAG: 2-oxo acid dehydrogenase subunit E2 [Bdellovibrionales bacterium]|nr:2-oxo acid dehydrogenase subunit E2 [Bdellovibrionales bacterium]
MNRKRSSVFRHVALSLWSSHGDPSVYGIVDLDVTDVKSKGMLLPMIVKALGVTMENHPALYSIIKWGRIYQRVDKKITVMVNIPVAGRFDLSALNLDDVHLMSESLIREKINFQVSDIRSFRDPHLGPMLKLIKYVPRSLMRFFLKTYEILIYEFNTRLGLRFLPHRPFGSIIVSNVGSLGISNALLPLIPITRSSLMISVGKIQMKPMIVNETVCARQVVQMGVTFDHRLFDGSEAGKMLADFESTFKNLILKNRETPTD